MTDQDPTQRYDPPATTPAPDGPPPLAEAAQPPAPPAGAASGSQPAPVAFAPADTTPGAPESAQAVVTSRVAADAGTRRGGGRLRWLLVGAVVLVVGASAAAATLLLTSDSGDPAVLAWAPPDTLAYSELRLDLPGDQEQELAALMSAFPGFDDQAAFPTKLNEVLDQLVASATDGEQSWTAVDAWWGRQLSVSMGPIPDEVDTARSDARALVLANVEDAAAAEAWLAQLATAEGAATTTEAYNGVTLTLVSPEAGEQATAAWAVTGPVLAVGDVASVKASVDTGGTAGLNTVDQFQVAEASVTGDRLGFSYLDIKAMLDGFGTLAEGATDGMMPSLPVSIDELTVDWAVAAVRASDDAFVVETRNPHAESIPVDTASASTLASVAPPTTTLLAEGHGVGEALTRMKEQLAEQPMLGEGVQQLEDALRIVGGWDAVVGWMGEAGVAVTVDGDTLGGGILIAPTNQEDPQRLLDQVRGFIALAGSSAGVSVAQETYNGTEITVITADVPGLEIGAAPAGPLTISAAVTPGAVVIGYGTAFTEAVIDAQAGEALADTARFATALEQAGTTHSALVWLDIAGFRGLAEGMLPDDEAGRYQADLKPYLDALDSVIGTFAPSADLDRGTVIVRVSGD
jgi:hypothetical protein